LKILQNKRTSDFGVYSICIIKETTNYGLFNNPKNRSGFHEVIGKELIVFIEVYMISSLIFRELQLCKNLFFYFENQNYISETVICFFNFLMLHHWLASQRGI